MKTNDYVRKYGRALTSAPVTEYKDLLIETKDKKLKKINPLDVKYEGSSFGTILDMYHDELEKHSDYKKTVGHSISTLISLLVAKGYNTPNTDLDALINDIHALNIIEPNKVYSGFKLDGDYVKGFGYDVIFEEFEMPDDIFNGYWKYIDGKLELDKTLYEQMWVVN